MTLPGGTQEFTKTVYDGLDEPTVMYTGYDPANTAVTYAAAESVSGDVILTQTNTTYDLAGDDVFDASYNRLPTASVSDTGALDASGNAGDSQITYTAAWADGLGRTVATIDFGTNGGSARLATTPRPIGTAPNGCNTTAARP